MMRASAKTSETNLWNWLSKARTTFRESLHMNRVENSAQEGMPDVEGCLAGKQFWIELKTAPRPAKESTPIKLRFEDEQIPWLESRCRAGGRAFVLIQVGNGSAASRYLIPGAQAEELVSGIPTVEERLWAMAYNAQRRIATDSRMKAPQLIGLVTDEWVL